MNESDFHSPALSDRERLEGWKQIAGHLKCGKRTAQRWEMQGMPVHRHDTVGAVYAYASELDDWLNRRSVEKEKQEVIPENALPDAVIIGGVPKRRIRRGLVGGAVTLIAILVVFYAAANYIIPPPPRRSLAVLTMKDLTGRAESAWLSTALSEMLRTELAAGGKLRTISGEEVARLKRELPLPDSNTFSKETLARVRKNLGTDLLLVGSYAVLSGQIRVNLVLQDTRTGETMGSVSETGTESTLFQLVSHAGIALRAKLGVGELSPQEMLSFRTILPRNLDAQRLYAEGLQKLRRLEAITAKDILAKAIQAEPNYALGHAALADAWAALGYEGNAREEAKTAFDLSPNLAPEESLSIEAKYREWAKEWDRAIEIYGKLCRFSPQNLEHRLHLAQAQMSAGKPKEAFATIGEIRKLAAPLAEDPREIFWRLRSRSPQETSNKSKPPRRGQRKKPRRGELSSLWRGHI